MSRIKCVKCGAEGDGNGAKVACRDCFTRLTAELEAVKQNRSDMKAAFDAERSELCGKVDGLTTELEAEREKRVRAEEAMGAAIKEISTLGRQIGTLESRLKEAEESAINWAAQAGGTQAHLEKVVDDYEARLKEAEEEYKYNLSTMDDALAALHARLSTLAAENANLRAMIKGKTAFHSDEDVNKELGSLRAENAMLRKAVEAAKELADTARTNEAVRAYKEGQ